MPSPINYKPRPDLHHVVASVDADKECNTVGGFIPIHCEHCRRRYIIHCEGCGQQMTGCACTIDKTIARIKRENADFEEKRPWLEKRGKLWVPPGSGS